MDKISVRQGFRGLTAKRLKPGNFEGISLAAYRRLLGAAIAAAGGKEVPPHLAKVHSLWPAQQEKSLQVLGGLLKSGPDEIRKRHSKFVSARTRLGEDTLEALLRVTPSGEIRPCKEAEGDISAEEQEACHTIYSLYTLAIGTDSKVRKMLAKVLAGTARKRTGPKAKERQLQTNEKGVSKPRRGGAKRVKPKAVYA